MSEDRPYGPQGIWILMVMLAAIGFGSGPVFALDLTQSGVPPEIISFYRFFLLALLMLPFVSFRPNKIGATVMGMLAGAAMSLGWIGFVIILKKTTMVTAGVLYLSTPIFAVLFAIILLSQVPGVRASMAALMAVAAIAIVMRPERWAGLDFEFALLGLTAPFGFGFALCILVGWLKDLNPLNRLGAVSLGACLGALPLILLRQSPMELVPSINTIPAILGLGVGAAFAPAFVYVVAAPRLGAVRSALALTPELPTMIFFGWWLFSETPVEHEIAATVLVVLASLMLAISRSPKGRAPGA